MRQLRWPPRPCSSSPHSPPHIRGVHSTPEPPRVIREMGSRGGKIDVPTRRREVVRTRPGLRGKAERDAELALQRGPTVPGRPLSEPGTDRGPARPPALTTREYELVYYGQLPAQQPPLSPQIAASPRHVGRYHFGFSCTAPHSGIPAKQCDCSSLLQQSYRAAGVSLPRTTGEQINSGTPVYDTDNYEPVIFSFCGDMLGSTSASIWSFMRPIPATS